MNSKNCYIFINEIVFGLHRKFICWNILLFKSFSKICVCSIAQVLFFGMDLCLSISLWSQLSFGSCQRNLLEIQFSGRQSDVSHNQTICWKESYQLKVHRLGFQLTKYQLTDHILPFLSFKEEGKVEFHKKIFSSDFNCNQQPIPCRRSLQFPKWLKNNYELENNVFWLYVSMNVSKWMNHPQAIERIFNDWNDIFFWHSVTIFKFFEKLPSCGIFHQEINILCIVKKSIKWNDVQMFQRKMNSDLSTDLMNDIFLFSKRFLYCFHCTDEIRFFVPNKVNLAKISFS